MPFGEIFTGAFQRIWRHKKLWLLAMIGLALTGIGMLVSTLLTSRWMAGYLAIMSQMFRNPGAIPPRTFSGMMSSMAGIWAALGLMLLLGLIGYVINLVARAAIINEAAHAWRNEATSTGRGLEQGAGRAVYVFLLDLMWLLPALVFAIGGFIAFAVATAATVATAHQNGSGGLIALSWVAFACCGGCVALLYYLFWAVFSPLMYQSAVAGRRSFGTAVREGWDLARANLGGMIILWLLLLLVGFVLGAFQQALNAMVSLPAMNNWFAAMSSMMYGFGGGTARALPTLSGPILVVFGLLSTVLWFLITTFTQTLNLTVYSGAYQHLAGTPPSEPVDVAPAPLEPASAIDDGLPAPEPPVEERLVVPPDAPEEEAPPTL